MDEPRTRVLPSDPLGRPIRVVLFCGPVLERGMIRFAHLLEQRPDIELVGAFCQSEGLGTWARLTDLVRRRGVIAAPLLAVELFETLSRRLTRPGFEREMGRARRTLMERLHVTTDIHSEPVLARIRELAPDLGLIYGGPILRPELFEIPRLGTLGIHHGTLPAYRGKKTTFWALYHGEPTAGVTIQRVNRGIDTGECVNYGAVHTAGRSYRQVESDLEELGLDLYVGSVLAVRNGTARPRPIAGEKRRLFRDPTPAQLLRFTMRRLFHRGIAVTGQDSAGVLLMTESYHPMVGGGENQARALAAALESKSTPVTVITRSWEPLQARVARVDQSLIRRVGPTGRGHLKKWGLALTGLGPILAHRHTHRVLVVNGFRVLGIPAIIGARLFGLKAILKADSPGEMSGSFFDAGLARFGLDHRSLPVRIILALRNRLLRGADAFVAISGELEEELLAHGVAATKIHRIPNGIDAGHFAPPLDDSVKLQLRRERGLPPDQPVAVYTGRLVSYKGLPRLLRIWQELRTEGSGVHLLLVGEGSEDIHNCEQELRQFVNEHQLSSHVHFRGRTENVRDELQCADFFVFPTEEEAFGLAAIEAMGCGLPVISTRTGGLADFIREENGAIAFETDEEFVTAVRALVDDPALATEFGRRGRETALRDYSIEAVRDRYLELIHGEEGAR
jgi:glycosyltransferase involved in cell wall biosynthesis/folate-dependent phosphoribosylglycinamide formyltransferase PurN